MNRLEFGDFVHWPRVDRKWANSWRAAGVVIAPSKAIEGNLLVVWLEVRGDYLRFPEHWEEMLPAIHKREDVRALRPEDCEIPIHDSVYAEIMKRKLLT